VFQVSAFKGGIHGVVVIVGWMNGWMVGCFVVCLSGWLVSWLVGWLVGFLVVKREGIQPVRNNTTQTLLLNIYTYQGIALKAYYAVMRRKLLQPDSAGFEPVILATKWSQTYALDRAATGIGILSFCPLLDLDDHTKGRSKKRTNAPRGA
jgi:hypothetical protein